VLPGHNDRTPANNAPTTAIAVRLVATIETVSRNTENWRSGSRRARAAV
jgi:hypothetical protein